MNECKNVNLIRVSNLLFSGDKKDFIQKRREIRKIIIKFLKNFIIYKENDPK